MKRILFLFIIGFPLIAIAQKKPMDQSVYDGWQSISDKLISNDGKWIAYTITPQEGDATLVLQSSTNPNIKTEISRGSNPVITEDSKFLIFKIKPWYKDIRQAKIKKKKPDEMPKDSLGILEVGKNDIQKFANIKSFKTPKEGAEWVAFEQERILTKAQAGDKHSTYKIMTRLERKIDSLTKLVTELKNEKSGHEDGAFDMAAPSPSKLGDKSFELILRNLITGKEYVFKNTDDYVFDPKGTQLVFHEKKSSKDSLANDMVLLFDTKNGVADTLLVGGNDFRNFTFSEDGNSLVFLAERGSDKKALQKFYELYLFKNGGDTAVKIIDTSSAGMPVHYDVSKYGRLKFSKKGNRLLFGTAAIRAPKDTSLIDIDLVKLDIWNYKDDYLQSQQLKRLNRDLQRNYLAIYDMNTSKMLQLGSEGLPAVIPTDEGDGTYFVAITDTGRRVAAQWMGRTKKDIYWINSHTGAKQLVKKNFEGRVYASPAGKYILLYDDEGRNYFIWDGKELKNITAGIEVPLYDEENDRPEAPSSFGIMGWMKDDDAVFIYDRYDVWKLDPTGQKPAIRITPDGRSKKLVYRYVKVDREETFFSAKQPVYFRVFNDVNKDMGLLESRLSDKLKFTQISYGSFAYSYPGKAEDAVGLIYTKESYVQSPDLYFNNKTNEVKLSAINPQQSQYNWGTSKLYHWETFDSKPATGVLYKPEDFDSSKKYPMILYFYEKLSDRLNRYIAPAPTPSRLDISFFVSNDYLVFCPDISYQEGHPGKSAYNYIVSGAQSLAKKSWVDEKNIGIQGQSWGGYQVAYLITATNMFKAAWSGAPVVDMFSAYGGIRWGSGNNRQSQYEKGQSRIGATIWKRPDLYIENSPLFHLKNVNTPVVIMSNDADGAVPWYQGIEFFTAMRRLGKPAWLLNYNGEAHNIVERKNRKDISIREQQFFDWLLKGKKPPRWISEGVPATEKGRDWGLETDWN